MINLDLLLLNVSISIAKSKSEIVSTLFSPIISIIVILSESKLVPAVTLVVVVIPVSAKFFSPDECKSLLTGLTKSSHSIGLLIVYDRFW